MSRWTAADIPDQTGRTFIITGANSGLGEQAAHALAKSGATVVLACRNVEKAGKVAAAIGANAHVRRLDLANLESVRAFADEIDRADVLINNAGVMAVPAKRTADGFEMQIGTNHLGHFALTGLLLPKLSDRVVTLSSIAHRIGTINLDDLNYDKRRYDRWGAYGQSKLANLLFAYELQRKFAEHKSPLRSLAAHPGYANTALQGHTESIQDKIMAIGNVLIAQSAQMGALPELYAATVPDVPGGAFIGPANFANQRGYPKIVGSNAKSHDEKMAAALWKRSEELTGVKFRIPGR